jgi:hypothetical protein
MRTVLAIAARDYHNTKFYPLLMQEAKNLSGLALVDGWKSVEIVQAFILLTTYPPPSRRWDEDRTWMYLGWVSSRLLSFPVLIVEQVCDPYGDRFGSESV